MNTSLAARSAGLWSNIVLALLAPVAVLCTSFAAEPAPDDAISSLPVISADETVQKELLNLDRLLETNPKLEETLRTNRDHLSDENFQKQNPEVAALIKKNPGIVRALRTERHFFVLRAVGRLARGKLLRKDMVDLDKYLDTHEAVREALVKRPNQIVQSDFLIAHASLAKFMEDHPSLSTVLLERADKREKDRVKKAAGQQTKE
jgi:hypothetical protein